MKKCNVIGRDGGKFSEIIFAKGSCLKIRKTLRPNTSWEKWKIDTQLESKQVLENGYTQFGKRNKWIHGLSIVSKR